MEKQQALFNWSGGKDSTLALHYLLKEQELEVRYLLTTLSEVHNRISMHGVREELLVAQAESIGIPLYQVRLPESPRMEEYELQMRKHLDKFRAEGINYSVFGDIFLEDLRQYREKQLAELKIKAVFPLWKKDTRTVLKEFIDLGYQTIVVCAQAGLEAFCGRVIDQHFIDDLPAGIDPCGENGEFHTFVFDGPVFKRPVVFSTGEKVYKTFPSPSEGAEPAGYWYIDLVPYTES